MTAADHDFFVLVFKKDTAPEAGLPPDDITDDVIRAVEMVINSMDWGSGFFDTDEEKMLVRLCLSLDIAPPECKVQASAELLHEHYFDGAEPPRYEWRGAMTGYVNVGGAKQEIPYSWYFCKSPKYHEGKHDNGNGLQWKQFGEEGSEGWKE